MISEIKADYIEARKALTIDHIKTSPTRVSGPGSGKWGNADYSIDYHSISKNQVGGWFEAMVNLVAIDKGYGRERHNVDEIYTAILNLELDEPDGIMFEEPPIQKIKHELSGRSKMAVTRHGMPALDLEDLVRSICTNDYYVFSFEAFYETRNAWHYFRHWMMD